MINRNNIKTLSSTEIIMGLGERFKEYRLSYRLTQKEVAEKAGVSLVTLRKFENGQAGNITMSNFIALLKVVDSLDQINGILPEIPVSSYLVDKIDSQKPKRIRHAK